MQIWEYSLLRVMAKGLHAVRTISEQSLRWSEEAKVEEVLLYIF